jgi:hypothetical protein
VCQDWPYGKEERIVVRWMEVEEACSGDWTKRLRARVRDCGWFGGHSTGDGDAYSGHGGGCNGDQHYLGVMRVIYGCRRKLTSRKAVESRKYRGSSGLAQLAAKWLGTYCDIHYGHGPACLAFSSTSFSYASTIRCHLHRRN